MVTQLLCPSPRAIIRFSFSDHTVTKSSSPPVTIYLGELVVRRGKLGAARRRAVSSSHRSLFDCLEHCMWIVDICKYYPSLLFTCHLGSNTHKSVRQNNFALLTLDPL
eukprot:sb/3477525/